MREKVKMCSKTLKSFGSKLLGGMLAFLLLISMDKSIAFAADSTKKASDINSMVSKFATIYEFILNNYKGEGKVDEQTLLDGALNGMFEVLDDYSTYFTNEEYQKYIQDEDGYFYGIGVSIRVDNEKVQIEKVMEDSPASRAGLQVGDYILAVDGQDVSGMKSSEIALLVKGENDTKVTLKISRAANILLVDVIRGVVYESPVKVYTLDEITLNDQDNDTLYIVMDAFSSNLTESLTKELNSSKFAHCDKVIIDLRNNPGGYFTEALKTTAIFLDKSDVITTLIDSNNDEYTYMSYGDSKYKEIVVLINKNSASAAELLTAALKENKKAVVVGDNSFGKSVAQVIVDKGDIHFKLTTKEYLTPNGNSINGVGVEPDIRIEIPSYIYDIRNKYYFGDKDDEIITVKNILRYLGYTIGEINDLYDEVTFEAVKKFQADVGIGSYGGIDYTTQRALNTALYNDLFLEDKIFDKAVEVIRNYDNYIKK